MGGLVAGSLIVPVSLALVVSSGVDGVGTDLMDGSGEMLGSLVVGGDVHGNVMGNVVDDGNVVGNGMVRGSLVVDRNVVVDRSVVVSDSLVVNGSLMRASAVVIAVGAFVVLHLVVSVRGIVVSVVGLVFKIVVALVLVVLIVRVVGAEAVMAFVRTHVTVLIGISVVRLAVISGDIVVLIAVIGLVMRGVVDTVRVRSPLSISVVAFISMTVSSMALTVSPGITVGVAVAVSAAVTLTSIAVALTVLSTVVRVLRLHVMDRLRMALVIEVTNGLVVNGLVDDGLVVDGLVDDGLVVRLVGDFVLDVIIDAQRSVSDLVAHGGLVPMVLRGDVSIVMSVEVNLRVGVVRLLVVANFPVLLRHIGNGVAIKACNFAVIAVLGPNVLAGDMALGMAEAVGVVASAVETVALAVTLAMTVAVALAVALAVTLAITVAMVFVSHVVTRSVSDTGLAVVVATNSRAEVLVGTWAAKVVLSGHGVMLTVMELSEFLLMDRAEVLALVMAMDFLIISVDILVADIMRVALGVAVTMLTVVLSGSDGSDQCNGESFHVVGNSWI